MDLLFVFSKKGLTIKPDPANFIPSPSLNPAATLELSPNTPIPAKKKDEKEEKPQPLDFPPMVTTTGLPYLHTYRHERSWLDDVIEIHSYATSILSTGENANESKSNINNNNSNNNQVSKPKLSIPFVCSAYRSDQSLVCESPHPVPPAHKQAETLHFPGATSLIVIVDNRSVFHFDCKLGFYLSEDEDPKLDKVEVSKTLHCFKSGFSGGANFEIPGDIIYYRYVGIIPEAGDWGFRFVVLPQYNEVSFEKILNSPPHSDIIHDFINNYKPNLALDCQLAHYAEHLSSKSPFSVKAMKIEPSQSDIATWPLLSSVPLPHLRLRLAVLQLFNNMISPLLLIIISGYSVMELEKNQLEDERPIDELSIVDLVYKMKGAIFPSVKKKRFAQHIEDTITHNRTPSINLNRLQTSPANKEEAIKQTLFIQAYEQLRFTDKQVYQVGVNERPWQVKLVGEGATDAGGPYYDTVSNIASEIQTPPLSLFIPCPNAQLASEQEGIGRSRGKVLFNPSYGTVEMYECIGKLMGVAIRSCNPFPVALPALVWKPLVGVKPTLDDLVEIDQFCGKCLDGLLHAEENGITSENFSFIFFETFTTSLSDGSQIDLVPNGSSIAVTFENRLDYIDLVEKVRLFESSKKVAALRKGLGEVVSFPLLDILTWEELELMICGPTTIDLSVLKEKHTAYQGFEEGDKSISMLWEVLEGFSHKERSLFLRFACGRERLPQNNPHFLLTIAKLYDGSEVLPRASTCSSMFKMPEYKSIETMRNKILLAITSCGEIDNDFTVNR
eukprot:TRINITY_DN7407_c0_g1_i3.p1 TRINITY_DN7407_c0_g1~~TRINITY_DN7407_c0_g1_i3.p1  ORF type:complete len:784 (-),score=154.99 TRINITY_DN7407_c0_g1_i3:111-2462(-)